MDTSISPCLDLSLSGSGSHGDKAGAGGGDGGIVAYKNLNRCRQGGTGLNNFQVGNC